MLGETTALALPPAAGSQTCNSVKLQCICPFKRSHLRKCHSPGHNTVVLQDSSRQILRVQDVPELSIYSQALLKTEELVTLGL